MSRRLNGSPPSEDIDGDGEREVPGRDSRQRILYLHNLSNRGLWALALFLMVSIAAYNDFDFLPPVPGKCRDFLGSGPSPLMIGGLLVLYLFSSLVLTLSRMIGGSSKFGGIHHVAYLTTFYVFYHFTGSLADNFWAVFAAGASILALEGYHLRVWCSSRLREEKDRSEKGGKKNPG